MREREAGRVGATTESKCEKKRHPTSKRKVRVSEDNSWAQVKTTHKFWIIAISKQEEQHTATAMYTQRNDDDDEEAHLAIGSITNRMIFGRRHQERKKKSTVIGTVTVKCKKKQVFLCVWITGTSQTHSTRTVAVMIGKVMAAVGIIVRRQIMTNNKREKKIHLILSRFRMKIAHSSFSLLTHKQTKKKHTDRTPPDADTIYDENTVNIRTKKNTPKNIGKL